jgi:hypothetical protein
VLVRFGKLSPTQEVSGAETIYIGQIELKKNHKKKKQAKRLGA